MASEQSSTQTGRVLVIGLDGATFDLIEPWAAQGKLPNLASLMQSGVSAVLTSTTPPVSAPAWASFMTGKNPGKHGVLLFQAFDLSRYDYYADTLVDSTFYAGETLFDVLSAASRRVISVGVPGTYPPFPVNGFMVSGFPCPPENYTFPPELADRLGDWHPNLPRYREVSSEDLKIEDAKALVERHTSTCIDLMRDEDWDLFVFVLRNTDSIAHDFWRYMDPTFPDDHAASGSQYRDAVLNAYRDADAAIGRLLRHVPENTTVFVVSDHGMTRAPTRLVHTNYWLRTLGLLTVHASSRLPAVDVYKYLDVLKQYVGRPLKRVLRRHLPSTVLRKVVQQNLNIGRIDWARTRAYRVRLFWSVEGVQINVKGRQPRGIVEPGREYEELRTRIIDAAHRLRDPATGESIVAGASRKEDLYTGRHLENIPDIIVNYDPDYAGGLRLEPPLIERPQRMHAYSHAWSATHHRDGVLLAWGENVKPAAALDPAHIVDVAPTLLHAMGVPIPSDMDGRVLVDLFRESFVRSNPVRFTAPQSRSEEPASGLTPDEAEAMQQRLRDLGYLD